jgi:hypothetical protein
MAIMSMASPRSRSIEAIRVFGGMTEIGFAAVKGVGVVKFAANLNLIAHIR